MVDDNVVSDRIDGEGDQRPQLIASQTVTIALAILAVALRLIVRRVSRSGLRLEEWLMIPALSCALTVYALFWWQYSWGFGTHEGDATLAKLRAVLLSLWIDQILYSITISLATFSTLALCCRYLEGCIVRYGSIFVGLMRFGWMVATIILVCLQCRPVHGLWDLSQPVDCSIDRRKFFLGSGITDIGLIVVTVGFAVPCCFRLGLSKVENLLLSGCLIIGVSVAVFAGLRFRALYSLELSRDETLDSNWTYVDTGIWTAVEINVAIISACLPCFGVLLSRSPRPVSFVSSRKKQSPILNLEDPATRPSQPRLRTSGPGIGGVPGAWFRISRLSTLGMSGNVEFGDSKQAQSTNVSKHVPSQDNLPMQGMDGLEITRAPDAPHMDRPPSWAVGLPLWERSSDSDNRRPMSLSVARPISHLPEVDASTQRSSVDDNSGRNSPWPLKS